MDQYAVNIQVTVNKNIGDTTKMYKWHSVIMGDLKVEHLNFSKSTAASKNLAEISLEMIIYVKNSAVQCSNHVSDATRFSKISNFL